MRCLLSVGAAPTAKSVPVSGAKANLEAGAILDGKYRIEHQLGRGGMGAVFVATHLGTTRTVAVKVIVSQLAKQEEFLLRFHREAEAAGRLRHPNVVNVTDFGITSIGSGPLAYLVMELLDGETLAAYLKKDPAPRRDLVLEIIDQLALGLDAAHEAGIVHRDLKPDNIWLESNRRGGYNIKVLDFGVAKLREPVAAPARAAPPSVEVSEAATLVMSDEEATLAASAAASEVMAAPSTGARSAAHSLSPSSSAGLHTTVGSVLGTPAYMAPEQCQGQIVDHRADLYSLAVIAYELFCGRLPFQAKGVRQLIELQINATAPAPRSLDKSIPAGVSMALMQALAKDPEARPNSAARLAAQLRAGVDGESHILAQGRIFGNNYFSCFGRLLVILFWSFTPAMAILFNLASLLETRKLVPDTVLLGVLGLASFTLHLFLSQLYKAGAAMILQDAAAIGYFRPRAAVILKRLLKGLGATLGMFSRTAFRPTRDGLMKGALWPVVWAVEGLTGTAALTRSRELAETQPWTTIALVARQYGLLFAADFVFITAILVAAGNYANVAKAVFSEKLLYWAFIVYPIPLSALFLTFGTAFDFLYRSARRCLGEVFAWVLPSGAAGSRKRSAPLVRPGTIFWLMPATLIALVLVFHLIFPREPKFAILDAAQDGRTRAVLKVLDSGISIESHDSQGLTPLAFAATQGQLDLVRALLDRGAAVNSRNISGSTPLALALANGQTEAARLLMERGADVRLASAGGRTPLMIAAMRGDAAMCRLLLDGGADAAPRDDSGKTARDYAVEEGRADVVAMLGGSPNAIK